MATLRDMISGDKVIAATVVFNPIMAKLAEQAGFPALYLGGGTLGYVKTTLEANLNVSEMCDLGIEIRAACPLPLILDAAAGWGDPMHMHRAISMAEAAGFAAIEIEDQILPKRAHHHIGIEHMVPLELMVDKVKEAVAARRGTDMLIIARTNGMRSSDNEDAIRRAEAYKKAGADVLMLGPNTAEDYRFLGERLDAPLMYTARRGGLQGTGMTLDELAKLGCRLFVDSSHPFLAGYKAWKECYESMAKGMIDPGMTAAEGGVIEKDMQKTIGLDAVLEIERRTVEK
jgi:methylisocitrate lyase